MLRWIFCAALLAGGCSSTANGNKDMHTGGGDLSGAMPGDLAGRDFAGADLAGGGGTGGTGGGGGGGGGTKGCAGFLSCFNNCGQTNACLDSCKAMVRNSSMTLLQNYIECVDSSCFNGGPCSSYNDTSTVCENCVRFGLVHASMPPQCSTQSTACSNDP